MRIDKSRRYDAAAQSIRRTESEVSKRQLRRFARRAVEHPLGTAPAAASITTPPDSSHSFIN